MKLDILIPHYHETEEEIRNLLDSIKIQQNVNLKDDVGVIIVNDGSDVILDMERISKDYPFRIEYYIHDHKGVSATRNACLDYSKADYVMFCDADDMLYNACGLYIVFREVSIAPFDSLMSAFVEETRDPNTKEPLYVNHDTDTTFVHGKIHRRQFLIDNNIRWNDNLTIHEDSYFNCLCQRLAKPDQMKYCPTPFYLWKWRDNSVCRHDPKYILKTYNNMLDSNTALVEQFLRRSMPEEAYFFAVMMIYDAYFTMNKDEWINQDNREYRDATEKRFAEYYEKFAYTLDAIKKDVKYQIVMGLKNRMFAEGLMMESVTFEDWISKIKTLIEEKEK